MGKDAAPSRSRNNGRGRGVRSAGRGSVSSAGLAVEFDDDLKPSNSRQHSRREDEPPISADVCNSPESGARLNRRAWRHPAHVAEAEVEAVAEGLGASCAESSTSSAAAAAVASILEQTAPRSYYPSSARCRQQRTPERRPSVASEAPAVSPVTASPVSVSSTSAATSSETAVVVVARRWAASRRQQSAAQELGEPSVEGATEEVIESPHVASAIMLSPEKPATEATGSQQCAMEACGPQVFNLDDGDLDEEEAEFFPDEAEADWQQPPRLGQSLATLSDISAGEEPAVEIEATFDEPVECSLDYMPDVPLMAPDS